MFLFFELLFEAFGLVLLGLPAASLAVKTGADTHRKTRYFEDRGKGIFGHMLTWYMAIEDHCKGTLHGHLVGWGGIPGWILQNGAGVQSICNAVAEVLNSQFCATVSRDILVEHAIRKVANGYHIANTWGPSKTPVLLSYLQHHQMGLPDAMHDFVRMTNDQAGRQNLHDHVFTCRHGYNGRNGCRLCKPSNLVPCTRPIVLEAIETIDEKGRTVIHDVVGHETIPMEENAPCQLEPLRVPSSCLIVWELARPDIQALDLAVSLETKERTLREVFDEELDAPELKAAINKFLDEHPRKADDMYDAICEKLMKEGQGIVVERSPVLSYCTGSHNNAAILGGTQQSKGCLFYLASYLGKNKVALEQCLLMLAKARKEADVRGSTANNKDEQIRKGQHVLTRTLNQLNLSMEVSDYQMAASLIDLPTELTSDSFAYFNPYGAYAFASFDKQSENFDDEADRMFAAMNAEIDARELEAQIQADAEEGVRNADDDFIVADDEEVESTVESEVSTTGAHGDYYVSLEMYDSFGPAPTYEVEPGSNRRTPVPYPYHYRFRGEKLQFLNRIKYKGLIDKVKDKGAASSMGG